MFLSNALPLRESLDPVFSIEFESDFFSVFSAFLPTVFLPFVVSTAGVSFFSTGLFTNFEFTVVTSLLYTAFNSTCVLAFAKVALAFSNSAFNTATDSSVLLAYFPASRLAETSLMYFSNPDLSSLASALGASAPTFAATATTTLSLVFSTFGWATGFEVSSFAFVVLFVVVLLETSSDAWATAPAPKKILAPITTDAAPTLNFLIEYDSTFVPSFTSFKNLLFFPIKFFSSIIPNKTYITTILNILYVYNKNTKLLS